MDLFSRTELSIIAIIVAFLLAAIIILTIFDIKDYFKNKKNGKNIVEDIKIDNIDVMSTTVPENSMTRILEEIEVLDFDEPVIIKKEEKLVEEEYIVPFIEKKEETNLVINADEEVLMAKQELERITNELENIENSDPYGDTITNFELEQEENAIISLDELVKLGDNLYDKNENIQYDDGDEPITIDEVINKYNGVNTFGQGEDVVEKVEEPVAYQRKESIPFISSIYGLEKKNNYELEFENTASYEKLEMELRKTNEFLDSLKEMYEKHEEL